MWRGECGPEADECLGARDPDRPTGVTRTRGNSHRRLNEHRMDGVMLRCGWSLGGTEAPEAGSTGSSLSVNDDDDGAHKPASSCRGLVSRTPAGWVRRRPRRGRDLLAVCVHSPAPARRSLAAGVSAVRYRYSEGRRGRGDGPHPPGRSPGRAAADATAAAACECEN